MKGYWPRGWISLPDAELLAIILRVGQGTFKEGQPGQNASDFARTLLKDFRGLHGFDRAHVQDLLKVPGLGPAKVAQIKAAFELGKKVCARKLTSRAFESSQAIADHFRPLFTGKRQEIVDRRLPERTEPAFGRKKYHRRDADPGHRVRRPHHINVVIKMGIATQLRDTHN